MVRSPASRRQDETPLTPPADKGGSELPAAPRGNRNRNSVNVISFGGCRAAEIPNYESDYYPRDATQRSLFREGGCECCDCDCDCSSDGVCGCLRRNKQCLLTALIVAATSFIIILVFSFSYYTEVEHFVQESEQKLSQEFHQHFFNQSIDEKFERPRKPVIEDSRERFMGGPYLKILQYERDLFGWSRKRREIGEAPRRKDIGSLRDAIERRKNHYEDVLAELQKMEDSILRYKGHFSKDLRTVFEPFSLTPTVTPTGVESGDTTASDVTSEAETTDASSESHTTTEEGRVKLPGGLSTVSTEDTTHKNLEEVKTTSSDSGSESPAGETTANPLDGATFHDSSDSGAASSTQVFNSNGEINVAPSTEGSTTPSGSVASSGEVSEDPQRTTNDQTLNLGATTVRVSTLQETSIITGSPTPGYSEEVESPGTTTAGWSWNATPGITAEPDSLEEATVEDASGHPTEGDQSELQQKSVFYFDLERPLGFGSSHSELGSKGRTETKVVGVSLAEAKRLKEENRKHLLLNSRVVTESSEILFPTAPDEGRPFSGTVESMKTSQQLSFTPTALAQYFLPYQLCFYADQTGKGRPGVREPQPRTFNIEPPSFFHVPPAEDDSKRTSYHFPTQQNFLSFNINNFAGHSDSTPEPPAPIYPLPPPRTPSFPFANGPYFQQQQPLFCTYIQPPLTHIPVVTGVSDIGNPKCIDCDDDSDEYYDEIPSSREIGNEEPCLEDMVPCRDGSACIRARYWCDNKIHCRDASDEIYCSCRERLSLERLCDGYLDCPLGEDELDCFGCPKSTFSCDTVDKPGTCIPLSRRCDDVADCPGGEDEADCSALFLRIQGNASHHVPYTKGYLHRNWKGNWYPVCVEVKGNQWATEACTAETGVLTSQPKTTFLQVPGNYKGPFIARMGNGVLVLQEHCKGHVATYVKCPEVQCGTRVTSPNQAETRFKRFLLSKRRNFNVWLNRMKKEIKAKYRVNDVFWRFTPVGDEDEGKVKREETGRVVGGKESNPLAWPWVVALYKNGVFHCGGIILDEKWAMTAAHCVDQYWLSYYEIRSGMLRRFSFSPMEQIRRISHVIIHEGYNKSVMSNDVALLQLQKPLHFNRWVRPACLPGLQEGVWGPLPGTRCIAIGWGATTEHGTNPDQMREVEVPILPKCRHFEDVAGSEICAGMPEGGKDTCQGDSGGPLLCRDSKSAWYVAGIVSHGEGCARPDEPGAYTRVSLYVDWIASNTQDFLLPTTQPVLSCPGFRCTSASKRCISRKWVCNGIVDCLNGEDELHCQSPDYLRNRAANRSEEVQETTSQAPVGRSVQKVPRETTRLQGVSERSSFAESGPRSYRDPQRSPGWFQCLHIVQTISGSARCDGIVDCEDGTDELFCSCVDMLNRNKMQDLICDGVFDCEDLSDERECFACSETEFNCRTSKQCVPKKMRCDGSEDCTLGEDEKHCYALGPSQGEVLLGEDERPLLLSEGRLIKNNGGVWSTACLEITPTAAAELACSSVGYSGYENYGNGSDWSPTCKTLNVVCSNRLTNYVEFYRNARGDFHWPWHGVVYSDGTELCSAALMERDWLLAPKPCIDNLRLEKNYIEVKLGAKKVRYREDVEYGAQFVRVDAIRDIGSHHVVLLHLVTGVNVTWHVRPLLLPFWFESDSKNDLCVATHGHGEVFLRSDASNPPRGSPRCYFPSPHQPRCPEIVAAAESWAGIIVCQSNIGWYPAATFADLSGFCEPKIHISENILDLTRRMKLEMCKRVSPGLEDRCRQDKQTFRTDPSAEAVLPEMGCDGYRCRGGKCISPEEMCDGSVDCPWGEDERFQLCLDMHQWKKKGCYVDEMRCRNGDCVPKTQFGDGRPDCGDRSDEPLQTTCLEYLNVTTPHRICDGTANCLDKSDEAAGLCPCSDLKFNCTKSENACVPKEYVCDGEEDCPEGEDEASCVGYMERRRTHSGIEVELIHMSYGVWHTLCSPRITPQQAKSICLELGFGAAVNMHRRNETRTTVQLDPYSRIKLNMKTTMYLRGSREFASITTEGFCDVLSIECR